MNKQARSAFWRYVGSLFDTDTLETYLEKLADQAESEPFTNTSLARLEHVARKHEFKELAERFVDRQTR